MASIPQFYPDCVFPTDLSDFSEPTVTGVGGTAVFGGPVWSEESLMPLFDNCLLDRMVSPQSNIATSGRMSFTAKVGASELAVPSFSDHKMDLSSMAGVENFGGGFQPNMCQFRDEFCGFLDDFKPVYHAAGENWGIQGNQPPAIEDINIKVGRYTEEERKERILRYLKKRNQRNFNKTIKYACRKTLADRRVRVRGRFARNSEICEERIEVIKNDDPRKESSCCGDAAEIKTDDDEWLQEAMASLMYLPYVAG